MVTLVNRAYVSTATTGTGTLTLGVAEAGYQDFAAAGVTNGDVVSYVIVDGNDWEVGTGTYSSTGPALSRTPSESSNGGSAINLSGNAKVFLTAAAENIQQPPAEGPFVDGDKTKLDSFTSVGTITGSATLDLSSGTFFEYTPTQNTTFVFSNPYASGSVSKFDLKITGADVVSGGPDISSAAPDFALQLVYAEDMIGLLLSPDGTVGYELNSSIDRFYYWTLSTPFDLSTATRNAYFFSIGTQDSDPRDFYLSPDGTKMFMVGRSSDAVHSYTLSTAFDLTSISSDGVSFSVSAQTTDPRGLSFKPDGTKMYVLDYASFQVEEYDLGTGFDLTTASHSATAAIASFQSGLDVSGDGAFLITSRVNSDTLQSYSFGTPFDISTLSTATPVSLERGENVYYADSGDRLLISSGGNKSATQMYTLGTPYDITTASLTGPSGQAISVIDDFSAGSYIGDKGLVFKPDGLKLFVADDSQNHVLSYTLSAAFDLTTASFDAVEGPSVGSPRDLKFKSDGLQYYLLDGSQDRIYDYTLTVAWDITSATATGNSFLVQTQDTIPTGFDLSPDGTKLFYTGSSTDTIYQYTLGTAWDITSAVYDSVSFSISAQASNSGTIKLSSDGTKLILLSALGGLFSYTLATPFDLSTASYDSVTYNQDGFSIGSGLAFNATATVTYVNSRLRYILAYDTATLAPATFTYPAEVVWPGGVVPASPAAGETDLLQFVTTDGGGTYLGRLLGDNFS